MDADYRPRDIYNQTQKSELPELCSRHGVRIIDFRLPQRAELYLGAPDCSDVLDTTSYLPTAPRLIVERIPQTI